MSDDDDDEDTHFCLRCNTTITGLDAYVAHRKSKCNQNRTTDRYGAGPSGLQDDICRGVSPVSEIQSTSGADLILHSGLTHRTLAPSTSNNEKPQADDYFFSSLCLQSSSKIGEPGGAIKSHGVLTRSKILERSNIRDEKPTVLQNEDVEVNEESESEESDDGRHPPPTSGGKWLPGFRPTQRASSILWKSTVTPEHKAAESETITEVTGVARRPLAPPPSHTTGKWDSSERPWGPLRKPNAFWCGPCNRRLSSRIVYERHIKSELHFKRTNPWRAPVAIGKRARRRTRIAEESSLRILNRKHLSEQVKGAKRRRGAIVCDVCNYRVVPHLMGKHLISHYHCSHPRNAKSDETVLKHITSIVHQAPFQCGLCKFYCNSQQEFSNHWASEMHRENDLKRSGIYWCPNCDFEADSSVDMSCHLAEELHRDRVKMVNHSVPLIIQKITPLQCDVCGKCFRYNVQVRAHSKAWGHKQIRGTASESYQEALSCTECPYKCFSLVSFQRHCYMKHKKVPYFCRRCGLSFSSLLEVKKHRKSIAHRDAAGPKSRRCPHCAMSFLKLSTLKNHLEEVHPNSKNRCLKCGASFTLKQQLSRHALACQIQTISDPDDSLKDAGLDDINQEEKDFSCNRCQFSGKTESELLVHKVLHDKVESTTGKFHCPYCNKAFNDSNMKKHMMTHTSERPYSCELCNYSFSRQDTLNRHVVKIHHVELDSLKKNLSCGLCGKEVPSSTALDRHMKANHQDRSRSFKCMECDQAFYEKGTLERHMQTHFGKKFHCPETGCIFNARSLGELKIHARTHSESRDFHCQQCTYCSKTKNQLVKHMKLLHTPKSQPQLKCPRCKISFQTSTHLKRHLRTHSGTKPYQCPHCSFACASLDNLRKHIIYSKIHPGKSVYECRTDDCSFTTNLSKDFKSHLVREHNLLMKDAIAHVAGIYKPNVDTLIAEGVEMHEISEDDHEDVDKSNSAETAEKTDTEKSATMAEFVYSAEVTEEDARLPTLASVALTPAKTDEDIIFIHIGGPDEQPFDPHIFHQSFPIIESFPGQSHYDNVETETTPEENP